MNIGFYVSAKDGSKVALVAGPYNTLAEAEAAADEVFAECDRLDPRAWFKAWGVMRLETAKPLPIGTLTAWKARKAA